MFIRYEFVRSFYHGLGQVVTSGRNPLVRFIGGHEIEVPGDTLRVVAVGVYAAEVLNREAWERFLDWRIYGHAESSAPLLPRRELDLADAMEQYAQHRERPDPHPAEAGNLYIFEDDLRRDAAQAPGAVCSGGAQPIKVVAKRRLPIQS